MLPNERLSLYEAPFSSLISLPNLVIDLNFLG